MLYSKPLVQLGLCNALKLFFFFYICGINNPVVQIYIHCSAIPYIIYFNEKIEKKRISIKVIIVIILQQNTDLFNK